MLCCNCQNAVSVARKHTSDLTARLGARQTRLPTASPVQQAAETHIQSPQALKQAVKCTRAMSMPALRHRLVELADAYCPQAGGTWFPPLRYCPQQTPATLAARLVEPVGLPCATALGILAHAGASRARLGAAALNLAPAQAAGLQLDNPQPPILCH